MANPSIAAAAQIAVSPPDPSAAGNRLRASEIRYRRLFETASDGILLLDARTGDVTAVNPALARLLGYAERDLVGRKLWEITPFDDVSNGLIAFNELRREKSIRYDDLPLNTRDGRSITVEFVSTTYLSDLEQVIQCTFRDITGRKQAETMQQTSDAHYRALFEYAPDGIVIADRLGTYIDANTSICRMLGYSRDELIGLQASDIVTADELQHISPALALIGGRTDYHREWQFRRKDGSTFSADVTATAMPDGNLLAMIRDVTTRNEADAALRTADEHMRFSLETAQVGVWNMDYTSGVLQWSDVMEAQYGLAPGTFGGTIDAFIACIHPEDRGSVSDTFGQAIRTGSGFSMIHRARWPDGMVRWLCCTGRILLDDGGRPLRAVGISQDVTERHTLEAQFQQAQKMEAVGRLAGGVAHDFNNLLTVILGFCELLEASVDASDPRHDDISEIQRAGSRATELTRQLLAFSRQQIIEPTLLDLNTVLSDMRPMLGRLIREDVKVVLGAAPGLAQVKADRGQIEQVIVNLAVNAQDAMPNGGILRIETANIDLDEPYGAMHFAVTPGAYVVVTVTDSGTGMTREVRERLFEPFFTTKAVGKGTGLGLATVHGIVMRGGGSINVYSELGRGTSFKVYLPQAVGGESVVTAPVPAAPLRPGTETVLVVEDSEALRILTKRLLEKQGYTVIVAASVQEAIRLFEENPSIDVLLTDVIMPGRSGPELGKQLLERRPGLPVIYMSGYTGATIAQHGAIKRGAAFLHKPFTADAVGRKLREVLDWHHPHHPISTAQ